MAIEPRRSGGVSVFHAAAVVAVVVVGVMVAFWALAFLAGIAWTIVKLAVVVVLVAAVIGLVRRVL